LGNLPTPTGFSFSSKGFFEMATSPPSTQTDNNPPPRFRRGPVNNPPRVLIYGGEKIGKTTFAAGCKNVVFLPTEDGNENHDCDSYDDSRLTFENFDFNLAEICAYPRDWEAVCVDTITGLERLLRDKVARRGGVRSITEVGGGFGKGETQVAELLQSVFEKLNYLRTVRKMAIIITAHATSQTFADPEGGSWDRWELRGNEKYTQPWVEWVDSILFAKAQTVLKEEKVDFGKRAIAVAVGDDPMGQRICLTRGGPGLIGGSRVTLPEQLPLNWNAFITAYANSKSKTK
jgi:hypothetical protein